jgi:hypothetical protein
MAARQAEHPWSACRRYMRALPIREGEDIISAGIAQRPNTRPRTAIAASAMIARSNSFSAIE